MLFNKTEAKLLSQITLQIRFPEMRFLSGSSYYTDVSPIVYFSYKNLITFIYLSVTWIV